MSEARSVTVRLSAEAAGFIRDMQAAGKIGEDAMRRVEKGGQSASASIDHLGSTAGRIGVAAAAGLGLVTKAAMDWESQFAGVEKTVDGTAQQLGVLEGELRSMARSMPATHQEIAATAEAAGQLGVAREDIADFTETMVMLGETTNVTADDAATSIAQFSNVMGTAAGDVDNFAATVVDLGNKGASTEGQILAMAQRVSGAGALIGASEQDVLALSAAMSNLGIQSELGGGAIQRVLVGMNTKIAQGGENLTEYAEIAGMSASDFAAAWEGDPIRAFDAFIQGLGRVQASGGDVASVLDQLGIEGTQNLQVMLRLAGAGDTLTTALDQSAAAWESNTALTDEYGKRLDTTAAQTQIAWNNIRDAGIEAGSAVLPVVADLADGVADVATAFGKLPDPIQSSITGLLGITAVVGGSAWFASKVITGVSETRQALSDLNISAAQSRTALAGIGKGVQFLAILEGLNLVDQALDKVFDSRVAEGSELTRQLDALARGEVVSNLDQIGENLSKLNNDALNLADSMFGWLPGETETGRVRDEIEKIDQALAAMVDSGDTEKAAAIFEQITAMAAESGVSAEEARDSFDAYALALRNLDPGLTEAGDATALFAGVVGEAADGTRDLGGAADGAAPGIERMSDALLESREAAGETANEFVNLGESLNDSQVSLGDWIADMQAQAAALRDFRVNAVEAAEKGLDRGLIRALQEAGPEGAMRMAQLADASEAEIRRASRAWEAGQREVGRYTDAVGGVPDAEIDVNTERGQRKLANLTERLEAYGLTTATAEAALRDVASGKINSIQDLVDKYGVTEAEAIALLQDQASGRLAQVLSQLNALDGKTATTYIRTVTVNGPGIRTGPGGTHLERAGGGPIYGPGTKTSDSVPVWASRGEFMMSAAAVDHYGLDWMFAANARRLADGGPVDDEEEKRRRRRRANVYGAGIEAPGDRVAELLEMAQAMQQIRDLQRQLRAGGKDRLEGLERQIAMLQLQAAQQELRAIKNREEREARAEQRQEARERRQELRERRNALTDVAAGLSFDSLLPAQELSFAEQMAAEINSFADQVREAGGKWDRSMAEWQWQMLALAQEYDATTEAIAAETARREELQQVLEDQQAQLEDLNREMVAFGERVAASFTTDAFGRSWTETTTGAAGPATAALQAAEARLAELRASGTGDSIAAAAEASRLIAEIATLREQAAAETSDTERVVEGLEAFQATLDADTANAERMLAALEQLVDLGLDPTSALFRELAESGDLLTAEQMAALTREQVDALEASWAARESATAELAAYTVQEAYGDQHAALLEQIDATTQAIETVDETLVVLNATLAVIGEDIRLGASQGVTAAMQPQMDALTKAIKAIPRELAEIIRTGKP